ncbi:MAG: hypothetical protein AAFS10_20475 [Myxococcota bacterium]
MRPSMAGLMVAICTAVMVCGWSGTADAQDTIIVPGFERGKQHNGLLIRLAAGMGGSMAVATHDGDGPSVDVNGFVPPGSLINGAIGGSIADDLILHASFGTAVLYGPKTKVGGTTIGDEITDDLTVSTVFIGPGLTYYIMPANVYLSGSVGLGVFSWDQGGSSSMTLPYAARSDEEAVGLSWSAMVGKEWWVGPEWGIGFAAMVFGGSATYEDEGSGPYDLTQTTWSFVSYGLLFSATYN